MTLNAAQGLLQAFHSLQKEVPPPDVDRGYVKEYRTVENVLLPGEHYHAVIYECDPGYKMGDTSLGHMFCQQRGWMGVQPYCEEDPGTVGRSCAPYFLNMP